MTRVLLTYSKRGNNTVQTIIQAWAPPTENDTAQYIKTLSSILEVSPITPLDLSDPTMLKRTVAGIILIENGSMPYSDDILKAGIQAALGS